MITIPILRYLCPERTHPYLQVTQLITNTNMNTIITTTARVPIECQQLSNTRRAGDKVTDTGTGRRNFKG